MLVRRKECRQRGTTVPPEGLPDHQSALDETVEVATREAALFEVPRPGNSQAADDLEREPDSWLARTIPRESDPGKVST